jgi:hypothetical protein
MVRPKPPTSTEAAPTGRGDNGDPWLVGQAKLPFQDVAFAEGDRIQVKVEDGEAELLEQMRAEYARAAELLDELEVGSGELTIRQRLEQLIGLKPSYWSRPLELADEFEATHRSLDQSTRRRHEDLELRVKLAAYLGGILRGRIS